MCERLVESKDVNFVFISLSAYATSSEDTMLVVIELIIGNRFY